MRRQAGATPTTPTTRHPHNSNYPPPWTKGWIGADRYEQPLFHRLVEAIDGYLSGIRPPFVRCPICTTTQLSIRGLPYYEPPDEDERADLPDRAVGMVLICGHMVCKPCWTQNVRCHNTQANNRDDSGDSSDSSSDDSDNPPPHALPRLPRQTVAPGLRVPHPRARDAHGRRRRERLGGVPAGMGAHYRYSEDEWAYEFPQTLNDGGEVGDKCCSCGAER